MRVDATTEQAAAVTALTEPELRTFLALCISRYDSKRIDAGALQARHVFPTRRTYVPFLAAPLLCKASDHCRIV